MRFVAEAEEDVIAWSKPMSVFCLSVFYARNSCMRP